MNKEEYDFLIGSHSPIKIILKGSHLGDQSNRILLYGYDVDRNTFEVRLEEGIIQIYHQMNCTDESKVISNEEYVPNKRVYPQHSDYAFCWMLMNSDVHIPFLGNVDWSKTKEVKVSNLDKIIEEKRNQLQELLADMSIPEMRRDLNEENNLLWLLRNLGINNDNCGEALLQTNVLLNRMRDRDSNNNQLL